MLSANNRFGTVQPNMNDLDKAERWAAGYRAVADLMLVIGSYKDCSAEAEAQVKAAAEFVEAKRGELEDFRRVTEEDRAAVIALREKTEADCNQLIADTQVEVARLREEGTAAQAGLVAVGQTSHDQLVSEATVIRTSAAQEAAALLESARAQAQQIVSDAVTARDTQAAANQKEHGDKMALLEAERVEIAAEKRKLAKMMNIMGEAAEEVI